jgi:hypothetical protein
MSVVQYLKLKKPRLQSDGASYSLDCNGVLRDNNLSYYSIHQGCKGSKKALKEKEAKAKAKEDRT